jgi:dihydrodipicolinate synthase/N-acetylneuraminate lyase
MRPIAQLRARLFEGLVIPAHPLALTRERKLDEAAQRALSRYYLAAGAGGIAVGVHTTQFEIHDPAVGLYRPVLELSREVVTDRAASGTVLLIGGVIGDTAQALREAELCRSLGYDAVLLGLGALRHASTESLIAHCAAVADILPVFGFYLQPAVGGRPLDYAFWRAFCDIPSVVAIKIAPFNRYQTLDVIRAVAKSGRASEIALYTGNDDHIVLDLLTPHLVDGREILFAGGLLGHWAYWTRAAVEMLRDIRSPANEDMHRFLSMAFAVTDCNAAVFDAVHAFAGCLPGIQEVLYRDGLLRAPHCLDPSAVLSPGQREEIDRIYEEYSWLRDDAFIAEHKDDWFRP